MATYNYTKTPINIDRLEYEIDQSSITIALDSIVALGSALTINFKAALSSPEEATLGTIVTNHTGEPMPDQFVQKVEIPDFKFTTSGLPKFSMFEPEGIGATIVTHNFSDKCSWFYGSVQVVNHVMSTSDQLVFTSSIPFWIDMTHGRCYDEDTFNANGMYNPVVKIDDVVQTTGFSINYAAGSVTFTSTVSGEVKCSFYRADKSYFKLKPASGKILSIKAAEVQFTSDVTFTKAFYFEAWFNHPTYGMIPVPGSRIAYKNAKDFISACNEGQGLIPKWNELQHDVHVFPFNYARPKPVKFSDNVEIRVYIQDDVAISGEFATATFYVTVDNEV